jgi:hypothetical protein
MEIAGTRVAGAAVRGTLGQRFDDTSRHGYPELELETGLSALPADSAVALSPELRSFLLKSGRKVQAFKDCSPASWADFRSDLIGFLSKGWLFSEQEGPVQVFNPSARKESGVDADDENTVNLGLKAGALVFCLNDFGGDNSNCYYVSLSHDENVNEGSNENYIAGSHGYFAVSIVDVNMAPPQVRVEGPWSWEEFRDEYLLVTRVMRGAPGSADNDR